MSPPPAKSGPGLRPLLCLEQEELVGAGFSTPDFALAACELPHAGVAVGQREGLEFLGPGIEAQDRVRAPVADPHHIGLVDIDGVGLRPIARQVPARPSLGLAVVAEEVAAAPAGDPEGAVAVAPDTSGALARHGRLQNRDTAGLEIDLAEIIAGEGGEEHLAIWCGGDTVGAGAARRVEHRHSACFGIESAIDTVLPGEPEHALAIEGCSVEIGIAPFLWEREELHCAGCGIDPGDR